MISASDIEVSLVREREGGTAGASTVTALGERNFAASPEEGLPDGVFAAALRLTMNMNVALADTRWWCTRRRHLQCR